MVVFYIDLDYLLDILEEILWHFNAKNKIYSIQIIECHVTESQLNPVVTVARNI